MLLPFQEGEVNKASKEEGKKSQQEKLCTIIRLNDLLRCAGLFRSYNELLPEFGNSVSVWHSGDLVLHFHKVKWLVQAGVLSCPTISEGKSLYGCSRRSRRKLGWNDCHLEVVSKLIIALLILQYTSTRLYSHTMREVERGIKKTLSNWRNQRFYRHIWKLSIKKKVDGNMDMWKKRLPQYRIKVLMGQLLRFLRSSSQGVHRLCCKCCNSATLNPSPCRPAGKHTANVEWRSCVYSDMLGEALCFSQDGGVVQPPITQPITPNLWGYNTLCWRSLFPPDRLITHLIAFFFIFATC